MVARSPRPGKPAGPCYPGGMELPAEVAAALTRALPHSDLDLARCRARRLPGLTNRSYRVDTPAGPYAVRLPAPGLGALVDRSAEATNARLAATVGVAPAVILADAGTGVLVTEWAAGLRRASARRLEGKPGVVVAAATLRRLHGSGSRFAGQVRLADEIDRYARLAEPLLGGGPTPDEVSASVARPVERLEATACPAPCHNDPSPGNWLLGARRALLVDWEFAAMNDPAWDLACLAAEARFPSAAEEQLLAAYHGEPPTPARRSRHALLRALAEVLGATWRLARLAQGGRPSPACPAVELQSLRGALDRLRSPQVAAGLDYNTG
jgi:thiamine kinase-like enzyme